MNELLKCKNVTFVGLWEDPEGIFGTLPVFELNEPSPEEWNADCERRRQAAERAAEEQRQNKGGERNAGKTD